ncbi:MAG: hypothetical protein DWQ34_07690 [Planctomycetota bacterium]|nr:MAG: hypothetical protein DWQ34_07690 [Planctomycetota bacterium]REK31056.1 MAG: hypothetical protein DWQ41_01120 [Planctomycetota bacterium]REK36828.1 MAG: hypothetical protein DWQ45_09485 [Planctomycetota bacterium]
MHSPLMPMNPRLIPLLLCLSLMGCGQSDGQIKEVFGSSQAIETVRNATAVTAYRLESYPQQSFDDYEMTAGPVSVPENLSAELQTLLLDPGAYFWETDVACEPLYGVRIEFQRDDDLVDAFFCFECDILTIYHNYQVVGGEEIDDIRSDLIEVMQPLFPDDEAIQSLE